MSYLKFFKGFIEITMFSFTGSFSSKSDFINKGTKCINIINCLSKDNVTASIYKLQHIEQAQTSSHTQ